MNKKNGLTILSINNNFQINTQSTVSETKVRVFVIFVRRNSATGCPLWKVKDLSNVEDMEIEYIVDGNEEKEKLDFLKRGIKNYFHTIGRLGPLDFSDIDCVKFTGILHDLNYCEDNHTFYWGGSHLGEKIDIGVLNVGDIILTDLIGNQNSEHMSTYIGNDLFIFKAGYKGGICVANSSNISKGYPFNRVKRCTGSNKKGVQFGQYLQNCLPSR